MVDWIWSRRDWLRWTVGGLLVCWESRLPQWEEGTSAVVPTKLVECRQHMSTAVSHPFPIRGRTILPSLKSLKDRLFIVGGIQQVRRKWPFVQWLMFGHSPLSKMIAWHNAFPLHMRTMLLSFRLWIFRSTAEPWLWREFIRWCGGERWGWCW